jgi:hypothetical protein
LSFTRTVALVEKLKARLESLKLDPGAASSDPLFQRVGCFGANRLVAAMKATFASEQRVCFIVPGGDSHANLVDATIVRSVRTTKVALLIADRALDADKVAALVGGTNAIGILTMKDLVIEDLFATPFTDSALAFVPAEGEPLVITDAEKPAGNLGRECWLQWLHCYAGEDLAAVPQ